MTQTTNVILTPGAINLAVEVIRRGSLPVGVGVGVVEKSSEVRALAELGIARVNGRCLVCDGGERALGIALRAQLEQNSAPLSGD